jgi:hypothetical protein
LLQRGRNPYSAEITREIQMGYYGRPLDPSRPYDPKDQQSFAYPVYVVFLMAPTVGFPFETVQSAFRWLLFALAAGSILTWLHVLRWKAACGTKVILVVLMLGWLPMVQGIKLQQLSLLVAGLLAACAACLAGGWIFCAGGILALATIKPQLTWPIVLWLLLWAGSDWRSRRRFVFGFGLVMLLLLGAAELVLPGWLRMFVGAIGQYLQYTRSESVLVWLFGAFLGRLAGVACVLACALCIWDDRRAPAASKEFGRAFALVLALTVVVVPMLALYNQILLAPAILALLFSESSGGPMLPAVRLARMVGAAVLVSPWIATVGLSATYAWLAPQIRLWAWRLPLSLNLVVPVLVFGLALLDTWMNAPRNLRDSAPAE